MGIRRIVIAAIFLALPHAKADFITGEYHFLMLLMYWPRSFCNSVPEGCRVVADQFIIHSLWPMYEPDFAVKRYNVTGCNDDTPADSIDHEILVSRLGQSRVDQLHQYWRSSQKRSKAKKRKKKKPKTDLEVWQQNWTDHGKCFNRPEEPWHYFNATLELAMDDNFLEILANDPEHTIVPDNHKLYNKSWITNAINKHIKKSITNNNYMEVKVSITCLEDTNGTFQFYQVRVCYTRAGQLRTCGGEEYPYCEGVDDILFPIA